MTTDFYGRASTWSGWVVFAGAMLFIIGCMDVILGFVAFFKEETFAITEGGLLVTTNWTAWGWAMLIWGLILILAGVGLFSGSEPARWFSIVVVAVNMIGQFGFFPAYPLWSLLVIGLSVAVLFALTARWQYAKAGLQD